MEEPSLPRRRPGADGTAAGPQGSPAPSRATAAPATRSTSTKARQHPGRHPVRLILSALGQTLITAGVVILLFCLYELQVTSLYTREQQRELAQELEARWRTDAVGSAPLGGTDPDPAPVGRTPPKPLPGEALALLRIPRLGDDYQQVVLEGVSVPDLKRGPGHYPGTALPGQLGNVVISGHRTTYGAPFEDLDRLRVGDAIVLQTARTTYTYRMVASKIVPPTAVDVLAPVPGRPGARPTTSMLTLTTCNPKYSARQRLIIHGLLDDAVPPDA